MKNLTNSTLKLFNTLGRKIEEFKPIKKGEVGLYTCGPTVYDLVHIGNLRAYIFADTLKRVLLANGLKVKHVMNITDIDDKTIRRAEGKKPAFEALTQKYEDSFWQDFLAVGCTKPNLKTNATAYVEKMVKFIEILVKRGFAYKADDGSIYFSIAKFSAYGELSGINQAELRPGARVAQDEYSKENPADFVLWKAWDEADGEIFWETSLGKGRPGWSIECSVMSTDSLGDTFDIHTGGVDNIFPHHENEIAQSQGYSGQKFVNYWLHNEHLLVDSQKMSKSLNNIYTLADIVSKGFSPLDFRYLCLGAHYRSKLNFTWEGLAGAKNTLGGIRELILRDEKKENESELENSIKEAFNNDLDTPKALALLHEAKSADLWLKFDEILGLGLKKEGLKLTSEQKKLVEEREAARKSGEYERADTIRQELEGQGIRLEDTEKGTQVLTNQV